MHCPGWDFTLRRGMLARDFMTLFSGIAMQCALKRSRGRGHSMGEAEQGTVVHGPFPVQEVSSDEQQEAVTRARSAYLVELLAAGYCRG